MKQNHFNSFFASHYTCLHSNSGIPGSQTYVTKSKFPTLQFKESIIIKIMRTLDTYRAHVHGDISIRMLKTFGNHFPFYLEIAQTICSRYVEVCFLHKKCDKQVINNYRPVSLPSNCRKIL